MFRSYGGGRLKSAGAERLASLFCGVGDRHVVVAIVLRDEAHARPVVLVVVRVVRDELLRVGLVQSVNLNGALQGVAQQEHLHLQGDTQGDNSTVTEGPLPEIKNAQCCLWSGVSLWEECK